MFSINNKPCSVDDYCVIHDYDGADTLEFDLSTDDALFHECVEHAVITEDSNRYIITKIDGSGSYIHVSAQLDLRDFYSSLITNYDNTSDTITNTMAAVLPSGWSFVNLAGNTLYRTVRIAYGTPADAMAQCVKLYGVVLRYNCVEKIVTAYAPESYQLSAAFVTEELNLRSLQYYGDSTALITRLEARGKDGMTFADINNGKSYVENYQYTNDVIYGFWSDERYTDKQSLLSAATAKLAELSAPARSYECDVVDLKKLYTSDMTDEVLTLISSDGFHLISSDGYRLVAENPSPLAGMDFDYQDLSLYNVVSLIDVKRGTQGAYQVVGVKDYPHYPEKNVVTLSSAAPSLRKTLIDGLDSEIEQITESFDEAIDELSDAVAEATEWITGEGSTGGNVFIRRDSNGKPYELLVIDTDSLGTATEVWRWNKNGLGYSANGYNGPYTTAVTSDGKIVADFIKTGTLDADLIKTGSILVQKTVSGTTRTLFELDTDNKTLVINTTGFTLDSSGNATFSGRVTSTSGTIGGWTIGAGSLSSNAGVGVVLDAANGKISLGGIEIAGRSVPGDADVYYIGNMHAGVYLDINVGGSPNLYDWTLYGSDIEIYPTLRLHHALDIIYGGTGASSLAGAKSNLGIPSFKVSGGAASYSLSVGEYQSSANVTIYLTGDVANSTACTVSFDPDGSTESDRLGLAVVNFNSSQVTVRLFRNNATNAATGLIYAIVFGT